MNLEELIGLKKLLTPLVFCLGGTIHSNCICDVRDGEGCSWS